MSGIAIAGVRLIRQPYHFKMFRLFRLTNMLYNAVISFFSCNCWDFCFNLSVFAVAAVYDVVTVTATTNGDFPRVKRLTES